jgi:hypothetical protein
MPTPSKEPWLCTRCSWYLRLGSKHGQASQFQAYTSDQLSKGPGSSKPRLLERILQQRRCTVGP